MEKRLLGYDGIENLRDFGGYAAAGRQVRTGRLLRSGHLASATYFDRDRLAEFRLGAILDLRRPDERRRQPSKPPTGFGGQVLATDLDDGREAPHVAFLKSGDLSEESGRRFMRETYARLPFDPAHVELFRRYFALLDGLDRPVLVHCVAGKDRTGVTVALTHHLLGVGRDDLMADYLLTNQAVDLERRAPEMARRLEKMTGKVLSEAAVIAFLGVEPDFLESAFAAIEAAHGDLDAYFRNVLGVDEAMRDRIRERLTA